MKISLRTLLATTAIIALHSAAFAEEAKEQPAASAAATSAEAPAAKETAKPAKDYVILDVNGDKIKYSEVEALWKSHFQGQEAPDFASFDQRIRDNLIRGVVSERLLLKEAMSQGMDKDPQVLQRLELIKRQLTLQSFMDKQTSSAVSDDKLKAAYEDKIKALGEKEEVHARHILVPTEAEAKEIHKQIKDGGDFEKLAKEKSKDSGSGAAGGDLGYFTQDKMVPQFGEAAFALKEKGDISEPVKSDFGWHIIKLEDRRKAPIPTFEQLRDSLKQELNEKAVTAYVESLLGKSKVKYFDAEGKKLEFNPKFEAPKAPAH